ncbi:MAG: AAA family ATPase [Candidatus Adiutrix sp.]|jgi:SpoVK/Ycf46/Vps4 family AAA+-type ATPase|nr:AAA family ATPase [Candidatus Adiutrix sp.]
MNDASRQIKNIEILIRSHCPIIAVLSPEEPRVLAAVEQIGRRLERRIFHWSCLSGLADAADAAGAEPPDNPTADPLAALQEIVYFDGPGLFVLKDFHPFLAQSDPKIIRLLREFSQKAAGTGKTVILTGSTLNLPPDLEKDVAVIDFPLPGRAEFEALLDSLARQIAATPRLSIDLSEAARADFVKASHGLTLTEAKSAFTKALMRNGCLTPEQLPELLEEKKSLIRKSGYLEYYDPEVAISDIGGLENLKLWLTKRKEVFSDQAAAFGLPAPRGVLLLGVQGCGKSVCVKAVSSLWGLPLLRLDIGRVFDARVGGSEENIRRAIGVAERIAPCILWIDEIDKAFGGQGGDSSDGGIARRVLGTFLTWLGEKQSPVFVAATANNIASLPSELLRKGRFDEIFFVDLPNEQERQNILAIHLRRRGRDPEGYNLAALARATDGFSGAEIEQAVISGLFGAFYDNARELSEWDMTMAAAETVPLSKTMREEIDALRQWCHSRARPASETRLRQVSRLARPTA